MRIAIDIDDTLNKVDRVGCAGAYIARNRLPYRLKNSNASTFLETYDWDMDGVMQFVHDGGVSAFTEAEAREGARETLAAWREEGHEIIILTARVKEWFQNPEKLSRDWLQKRKIPYDGIVANVQEKGRYCKEHEIDILIDDNLTHCREAQALGVDAVLAVRPHNLAHASEITYGGATWEQIDKAVRFIFKQNS